MNSKNLVLIQNYNGILTIQRADYIEDGFYIEVIGSEITIWEIPSYGGEARLHSKHATLNSAIEAFNYLT